MKLSIVLTFLFVGSLAKGQQLYPASASCKRDATNLFKGKVYGTGDSKDPSNVFEEDEVTLLCRGAVSAQQAVKCVNDIFKKRPGMYVLGLADVCSGGATAEVVSTCLNESEKILGDADQYSWHVVLSGCSGLARKVQCGLSSSAKASCSGAGSSAPAGRR